MRDVRTVQALQLSYKFRKKIISFKYSVVIFFFIFLNLLLSVIYEAGWFLDFKGFFLGLLYQQRAVFALYYVILYMLQYIRKGLRPLKNFRKWATKGC